MLKKTLSLLLLGILSICVSACSKTPIVISDAYVPVRSDSQKHFVAYFKIHNNSNKALSLQSITSPHFKNVMLHETKHENGIAKMRHLEFLNIPASSTAAMEPNAKHVMLMMPLESIWSRDSIQLDLHFADESIVTTNIPIRKKTNN